MKMALSPGIKSIEKLVREHYPNRKVVVWCEEETCMPGAIKIHVRVDNAGAYYTASESIENYREREIENIAYILSCEIEEVLG